MTDVKRKVNVGVYILILIKQIVSAIKFVKLNLGRLCSPFFIFDQLAVGTCYKSVCYSFARKYMGLVARC